MAKVRDAFRGSEWARSRAASIEGGVGGLFSSAELECGLRRAIGAASCSAGGV